MRAMPKALPLQESPSEFGFCETIGEVFAYLNHRAGMDALRQLIEGVELDRESLEDAADELKAAGLIRPASIVLTAMADAVSRFDPSRCPYEAETTNARAWLLSQRRSLSERQQQLHGKRPRQ